MTDLPVARHPRRGYTLNAVLSLITLFGIAIFIVFLTVPGGIERKALASLEEPTPEATPVSTPASTPEPTVPCQDEYNSWQSAKKELVELEEQIKAAKEKVRNLEEQEKELIKSRDELLQIYNSKSQAWKKCDDMGFWPWHEEKQCGELRREMDAAKQDWSNAIDLIAKFRREEIFPAKSDLSRKEANGSQMLEYIEKMHLLYERCMHFQCCPK